MNRTFRSTWIAVLLTALIVSIPSAYAALKVWSGSETIQPADLNSNFTQVNNAATALITNSRVATAAAIAHSKLATPAVLPKAWAKISANCGVAPCSETIAAGSGVSAIQRTAAGIWTVTWSTARADASYGTVVSHHGPARTDCYSDTFSTTLVAVRCVDAAGVAVDTVWTITMMDNL